MSFFIIGEKAKQEHKSFGVPKAELIKSNASELLINCFQTLPGKVKAVLLSDKEKSSNYKMLSLLLTLLQYSPMDGMKFCISEFYKTLLDPEIKELTNEFFDVFYDKLILKPVEFLSQTLPLDKTAKASYGLSQHLVLDILIYCMKAHGCKMRYFMLHSNMLLSLNILYKSPFKYIRLDMIRLMRTAIGTKEEPLYRHIAKNDLFGPVFSLINVLRAKDSLLHSALLELFSLISKENIKTLLNYLAEKYQGEFSEGKWANKTTFKVIKEKLAKLSEEKAASKLTETAMTALGKKPYLSENIPLAKTNEQFAIISPTKGEHVAFPPTFKIQPQPHDTKPLSSVFDLY